MTLDDYRTFIGSDKVLQKLEQEFGFLNGISVRDPRVIEFEENTKQLYDLAKKWLAADNNEKENKFRRKF